jgi:hypothetical protein
MEAVTRLSPFLLDHFSSLLFPLVMGVVKHNSLESMDNKALSLHTTAVVMNTGGVPLDGAGVSVSNGGLVQGSEGV